MKYNMSIIDARQILKSIMRHGLYVHSPIDVNLTRMNIREGVKNKCITLEVGVEYPGMVEFDPDAKVIYNDYFLAFDVVGAHFE